MQYWGMTLNVINLPSSCQHHALFLRLGLPSTLIPGENGAVRKLSLNWRSLRMTPLRFSVDEKHFENGAFRKG